MTVLVSSSMEDGSYSFLPSTTPIDIRRSKRLIGASSWRRIMRAVAKTTAIAHDRRCQPSVGYGRYSIGNMPINHTRDSQEMKRHKSLFIDRTTKFTINRCNGSSLEQRYTSNLNPATYQTRVASAATLHQKCPQSADSLAISAACSSSSLM